MHTQTKVLTMLALATALASGAQILGSLVDDRAETQVALEQTIDVASDSYRQRTNAGALKSYQEKVLHEMQGKLTAVGKEKRDVRLALSAVRKKIANLEGAQTTFIENERFKAAKGVGEADEGIEALFREEYLASPVVDPNDDPLSQVLQSMLYPAPEGTLEKTSALALAREELLQETNTKTVDIVRIANDVQTTQEKSKELAQKLEELRAVYLEDLAVADRAQTGLLISNKQLAQAKVIAAEVHRSVLRLQSNLASIDGQLRHDTENSLVQMGLLSAAPEDAPVKSLPDNFIWPVEGPLAAHFHDALYLKFFGIPHQGIDIITHQLTPVKSAADGIVFLVKDGGLLGYTYVLIGHRDGIATLYGHLNVVQVAPGQEIHRGDVIGLSGGAPGTAGAGLITTGPHLHFEVIQNGINIDPLSVLP